MRKGRQYRRRQFPRIVGLVVAVLFAQAEGAVSSATAAEPTGPEPRGISTTQQTPAPRITFAVAGMAATAAVVGSVFGVKALHAKAAFDGGDRTTHRVDDIERAALISDIAFGAALALGVSALVLYLDREGEASDVSASATGLSGISFSPIRISAGGGAAAAFRF